MSLLLTKINFPMSFAQFAENSFSSFEANVKPFTGSRKLKQAHLMPTRSNTPEETSPTRSNDNDSISDVPSLTRSFSRSSENNSDYGDPNPQFEIE